MTHTYAFGDAAQDMVIRTSQDGTISHLVWPLPIGFTHDQWVADGSPTPSAYARVYATTDVDVFMAARLAAGFNDTGGGNTGKVWQCDDASIGRWTALGATAGLATLSSPPTGTPAGPFTLIAADNSTVSLTAAQTYGLVQRMMVWVTSTRLFGRAMKNNILASNPPADITVGWP